MDIQIFSLLLAKHFYSHTAKHYLLQARSCLPKADFKDAFSNLVLYMVHCFLQLLSDGLAPQGLHVEVVGPCWEDQEGHNCHLAAAGLENRKGKV